jgi:hypothetical protein
MRVISGCSRRSSWGECEAWRLFTGGLPTRQGTEAGLTTKSAISRSASWSPLPARSRRPPATCLSRATSLAAIETRKRCRIRAGACVAGCPHPADHPLVDGLVPLGSVLPSAKGSVVPMPFSRARQLTVSGCGGRLGDRRRSATFRVLLQLTLPTLAGPDRGPCAVTVPALTAAGAASKPAFCAGYWPSPRWPEGSPPRRC